MNRCLKWLCCCCDVEEQNPELPRRPNPNLKPPRKLPKVRDPRLVTKYCREEFAQIGQEERSGQVKAYCCPICFLYFKRILACSECFNFTCLSCYEQYDKKNKAARQQMKCPFCASTVSKFTDYELDPHSYFDASKQGFISKDQRQKIDNEIRAVEGTNQEITVDAHEDPTSVPQPLPSLAQ